MYCFIEDAKLPTQVLGQTPGQEYGPVASDPSRQFQTTARFKLPQTAKAFACLSGRIIVQPSDQDPVNLVNVALMPDESQGVPVVKYFVYRGLTRSSFFTGSTLAPADPTNSQWLARSWPDWQDYNGGLAAALPDPGPAAGGYDANLAGTVLLEHVFDRSQGVQVGCVLAGDWIGDFAADMVGFEVVTDNLDFFPDLSYLRAANYVIDLSNVTAGFPVDVTRERVLAFLDPAAFFGLQYNSGITFVTYDANQVRTEDSQKEASIYTRVVQKFVTRNRVYIDI